MDTMQAMTSISNNVLRDAIKNEYAEVALNPNKGYHFHTGRVAANRIGYDPKLYADLPEDNMPHSPEQATHLTLVPLIMVIRKGSVDRRICNARRSSANSF